MSSSSSSASEAEVDGDSSDHVGSGEVEKSDNRLSDDGESSDVGDGKSDNPQSSYVVKCRTRKLIDLMSKFNEEQKAAVNSIGFGGLFQVGFNHYPTKFVNHFVNAFNDGSHVFRASDAKFLVTKHDVHDCFLLPLGPEPVPKLPTARMKGAESEDVKEVKERWRRFFNVTRKNGAIPIDRVEKAVREDTEGGIWFKQCFVLFAVSYFLCPTSSSVIDMKLIGAVDDASRIVQFDWCSFVLEALSRAACDTRRKVKCLLGCWPFLMITYFHRYDFRGRPTPVELPLVRHWDYEKMLARVKAELVGGDLGRQVMSSVKYPISLYSTSSVPGDVPKTHPRVHEDETVTAPKASERPVCNEDGEPSRALKKSIVIDIPSELDDDEEIRGKAVDEVHELYMHMQRNAVAFHYWYTNAASRMKKLTTPRAVDLSSTSTQSTQAFFENLALHIFVDEVVEAAMQMKSTTARSPVFPDATAAVVRDVVQDIQRSNEVEDSRPCNSPILVK
ncbi:hypothetical protein RND81_01G134500 [Saponaria officinalis]|uniref:Aminotransferase-like plant mobile domain-containing protein n=1 Tax=Saponaria officinalis TaxID=3572 RepID=A0AAW1NII8_SAPOF